MDVVNTSNKDDATTAVAGVIYQNTDPELGGKHHILRGLSSERIGLRHQIR